MNKKITLAAVLMLLSTYTILPAYCDDEIDFSAFQEEVLIKATKSTYDKALETFNNKDFQSAIMLLNSYISSKPKKYEAYRLRGDAYYELRQYSAAERDYQTAIELKSSDDKIMTGTKYISAVVLGADKNEQLQNAELGELYGRLMYAQKAQNNPAYATAYENAQKYNSHIYLPQPKKSEIASINCPQKYGKPLTPQGIDVEIYGAIDDIGKEDYNAAIFKLQKVVTEYPNYYLGHYLYGVVLNGLEKDEEAIAEFEKSISLNPNDFESYASLGQIYYSKSETSFSPDDAKKSIQYFKNALKYNENCHLYYFYIGLSELQQGNNANAIANFDKALKLNASDYNSMYYKLIAQFSDGDYNEVIEGATNLLYKHVSNYNSVMYLRALAYSRLGNYGKALSDLGNIQNNIEDIYNADIKVVTERDKALQSYIYYLKSEIAHINGSGASADTDKAMQNPVIAQLSRIKKALQPYENSLNSEKISLEDYKKYESFYNTGLVKMLQSGIVITEKDVENQYDYIRTTFDDLGLSFKFVNPDYKLTTIENYPYKKYSSKLNIEDLASIPAQENQDITQISKPEIVMKAQTPQIEMLEDEAKPSLAKMLASNELVNLKKSQTTVNDEPITPDGEKVKDVPNIASGEPFIYVDKPSPLVDKQNTQDVTKILEEEKAPEIKISNAGSGDIMRSIFPAKELKESGEETKQEVEIPVLRPREEIKEEKVVTSKIADEETVSKAEQKLLEKEQKAKEAADEKVQKLQAKQEAAELKAQQKVQKAEQLSLAKAQKAEAKARIKAQKAELKLQKSQQRAEQKAKKAQENAIAKAERAQLKKERAEAKAEFEAKKALENVQQTQKEEKTTVKERFVSFKNSVRSKFKKENNEPKEKFSIKKLFSKLKRNKTKTPKEKTVIKSLSTKK